MFFFLFVLVVFLELFGLFILLIKLIVIPLSEHMQRRFFSKKARPVKSNEDHQVVQLTRFVQLSADEDRKKQIIKELTENDTNVPIQANILN